MKPSEIRVTEAVQAMTYLVNSFSDHSQAFNAEMSREHRTIQNSFSKLCFAWVEHIASNEYRTDLRNKSSQDIAKRLLEVFKDDVSRRDGFTGSTLELMAKPSAYCCMV